MKHILLLASLVAMSLMSFAQSTPSSSTSLLTPDQFLGYRIGSRFTPHYRVLAYAEQVARQLPNRVKLIPYGTTYEGRQLMVVAIASEANMARLEEIRTNNLKRIGLLEGTPTSAPQPPIAWLSYNVHGNEAVSSEAFMEVLYRLLNTTDAVSQKIMNTTVVLLDPGLNPDGHDRYVNWYNQMLGRTPNPAPNAREHNEPWPGGRYTHYLFDPNRDWAWQTQEITQQRMALYQQWMPQLHGDFHEMGVESPYYFAPSAKPYHEDITPYQRQFQQIIGQYCSRYFDRNGWLYYTRERFDLFYPSYGDTYPTYNGAIGMTYEQGGSGRAGLAITKADGDTLTLRQRIDHHYTASMATLESVADRPAEIVKEFGQFFDKSRNTPIGPYKSYVIKSNGDAGRLKALQQLLDRNKISFGVAGKAQTVATGFNYTSQKTDKNIAIAADDIVISAYQPKSTLLKILFEQNSALEDSATYDITAWSLPYAFGLHTYGLASRIDPKPLSSSTPTTSTVPAAYAYLIRWQSLPAVQTLAALLKQKIRVRAAEKPFELEGKTYASGTLIVARTGNENLGDRLGTVVAQAAAQTGAEVIPVQTGFVTSGSDFGSDFVTGMKAPRVGLVLGDGTPPPSAGEVWHFFDQELNYPVTLLDGNTLGTIEWNKLDVLVLPTNYNYGRILNERTLTALKEWIRAGGKLIAMERAAAFLAGKEGFDLKEKSEKEDGKKEKKGNSVDSLKTYINRERAAISDDIPGSIYRVNVDTSHPLGFGLTGGYYTLVQNAFNFDFLKDGWNVGYLKGDNYVAGFSGRNAKEKLKNTLLMGVQEMGRGSVVYLADDPLFRGFWYNGKLLFSNAVFMVGN
ncbi:MULTISPECIES: M14 metallopeptidase family protein [unclassified Spirosoma]|uniref:M14 metallopeptidase family protein n=1 Tax=unclassified Spirosoma TaxID=2621999 RepID=UPI0009608B56|nr:MULTISPECIES: M14 metallopeptidase family protein [unclassified Spirosoma]MBN8820812.1 zinc carboxypeptidase [Spirosoma sp.]OJW74562.1 MAG: zinc carboxypeptidase [Spirosoma sp. 48-14]